MGNLARALHDELCETFDCRYVMPDLDIGRPVRVPQFGHQYPREFWEGVAQAVVEDYTRLRRVPATVGEQGGHIPGDVLAIIVDPRDRG